MGSLSKSWSWAIAINGCSYNVFFYLKTTWRESPRQKPSTVDKHALQCIVTQRAVQQSHEADYIKVPDNRSYYRCLYYSILLFTLSKENRHPHRLAEHSRKNGKKAPKIKGPDTTAMRSRKKIKESSAKPSMRATDNTQSKHGTMITTGDRFTAARIFGRPVACHHPAASTLVRRSPSIHR